jgi:tripartite-type tricarboxylate transporter receptor subunit TctC
MRKLIATTLAMSVGALVAASPAAAQASNFYEGKTIRLLVGWAAGGGFDLAARTVAKHLSRTIPGNPTVIVENMTGAGSLNVANFIHNVARPDGLTIGMFTSDIGLLQALDHPVIKADVRKFAWIGSVFKGTFVCAVMGFTGLQSWNDIAKSGKLIQMGATRRASNMNVVPTLLNRGIGTKFKVIVGFRGTADFRLALQRRELDGACWNWVSMKNVSADMLQAKGDSRLIPFAFSRHVKDPGFERVPLIQDLISDPEARATFERYIVVEDMAGPFAMAPNTPQDRAQIVRTAFKKVFEDKAFMADAHRVKLEFEYGSPDEIARNMDHLLSISAKSKSILKSVMGIKSAKGSQK